MKRFSFQLLILAGCLTIGMSHAARAATPTHLWSQRFGDANDQYPASVATDASGNVIVAGYFRGTVDFGGGPLTSAGGTDIFVAKFDPAGVCQWSQRFGDASDQNATSLATDVSGNVIVTGHFFGTVNFGGGNLTSVPGDIFVAKFNSAGIHQWSLHFGVGNEDSYYSVATDGSGSVIVAGNFQGTVNFGGGNLTGSYDIFVAKFTSAGVHQWSQRFGDGDIQMGRSVTTDASGSVIVAGYFFGTVDFGGGPLTSAGHYDIFVAKFNAAGMHQWSYRFGDASPQGAKAVATDGSGNVIVTGELSGTVDFGGGPLTGVGSMDIFVAKFNSAGVHQWSYRFGDGYYQGGHSVATDGSGNVIITGEMQGTVDFGGGPITGAGFLAEFNSAGVHQWSQGFGNVFFLDAYSAATDASGNAILTGYFSGTVDFGGSPLSGTADIIVAKLSSLPTEPVITSIVDIGNDQGRKVKIRFDRSAYDQSGAPTLVVAYEAYRRDDAPPAATALRESAGLSVRELLDNGWTYAGEVPAHWKEAYGIDVPTIGDSTIALGQYNSVFFIRAATDAPGVFYDSAPDSGYSLDNLAPGIPASFVYATGQLSWDKSTAEDFDYFSVYGSNTNSFASATLIDYTVSPALDVTASPYTYYFTTATDFSGNEGKPATVNTLSGVGGTPASYVLSISSYPNPFNPQTTIRYTVPSRGHVTVDVYDARGAHVATLLDEEKTAGAYTMPWDGAGADGARVGSGVYFARVTHPSGTKSYKLVLLK